MARPLHTRCLLLASCAAAVIGMAGAGPAGAVTPALEGSPAPGTTKQSPYAAAKDETDEGADVELEAGASPTDKLGGTKAAGSKKQSPYAAAKDETSATVEPTLGKLWGLVLPVGLAAGSYVVLRRRESGSLG